MVVASVRGAQFRVQHEGFYEPDTDQDLVLAKYAVQDVVAATGFRAVTPYIETLIAEGPAFLRRLPGGTV
jgi:hypothetical protein